ncbi:MAG: Fic family protein [Burkholderiaceae bacterium]|nr:Fic family protein [Burkholderiaceae bacterium]
MTNLSPKTDAPAPPTSPRVPVSFRQAVLEQLTACKDEPQGLSLQALMSKMPEVPKRSAQRWLAVMVDAGWLGISGRARATRYHLRDDLRQPGLYPVPARQALNETASAMLVMREPEASLAEIPLSTRARDTLKLVSQPLSQRQKVTYNPKLLEEYEPNVTAYLPADLCERLLAQGRVYADAKPAGTYARELANRLLIDLAWNSSRLEGNTYSLLETERLLSMDVVADNQSALDTQMILNHKVAIEFMLENAAQIGFTRFTILNLHAMLSDNLLADPSACGALRKKPVFIGQSSFTPANTPQQIQEWFDLFLAKAGAIDNPFEQALFTLVHLPYLQPFEDVNKRTARLAANIGLFANNLCPLSFVDMPQVRYVQAMLGIYELGRIDLLRDLFVWGYLRSCARYNNYLQVVSAPDPLRMKYRSLIQATVAHVVTTPLSKTQAIAHIRNQAQTHVEPDDQARFIEVVETQLMSLHEGNMARYGVKPAQFAAWMKGWT